MSNGRFYGPCLGVVLVLLLLMAMWKIHLWVAEPETISLAHSAVSPSPDNLITTLRWESTRMGDDQFALGLSDYQTFVFSHGGKEVVTIRPNGAVIIDPDYTTDSAARAFWEALSRMLSPTPCAPERER